jgi:hypothetical protein
MRRLQHTVHKIKSGTFDEVSDFSLFSFVTFFGALYQAGANAMIIGNVFCLQKIYWPVETQQSRSFQREEKNFATGNGLAFVVPDV